MKQKIIQMMDQSIYRSIN